MNTHDPITFEHLDSYPANELFSHATNDKIHHLYHAPTLSQYIIKSSSQLAPLTNQPFSLQQLLQLAKLTGNTLDCYRRIKALKCIRGVCNTKKIASTMMELFYALEKEDYEVPVMMALLPSIISPCKLLEYNNIFLYHHVSKFLKDMQGFACDVEMDNDK